MEKNILQIELAGTSHFLNIEKNENNVWVVVKENDKILKICELAFDIYGNKNESRKSEKHSFCRFAYVEILSKELNIPVCDIAKKLNCTKRNVYYCREQANNLLKHNKFFIAKMNNIIATCHQEDLI